MADEFPAPPLKSGGQNFDLPALSDLQRVPKDVDVGPSDLQLLEEAKEQTQQLPFIQSDLEATQDELRKGRGFIDRWGLLGLGLDMLPGGDKPQFRPDLIASRQWDPMFHKAGKSLDDEWKESVTRLIEMWDTDYGKRVGAPTEFNSFMDWLVAHAANPENVKSWSLDNPLWDLNKPEIKDESGKVTYKPELSLDVANALNFYAMQNLGYKAPDVETLYKKFPELYRRKAEVGQRTGEIIQNNIASGNVENVYVATTEGQAVAAVPRFGGQETNDELSNTINDPFLRELYRVQIPKRLLDESASGWASVTQEELLALISEELHSEALKYWNENRTYRNVFTSRGTKDTKRFARYAQVPMYTTFDGKVKFNADSFELGLYTKYKQTRARERGYDIFNLTEDQETELDEYAYNRTKKESSAVKGLGRGLIHDTDPYYSFGHYLRGKGIRGKIGHVASHLATIGVPLATWPLQLGKGADTMPTLDKYSTARWEAQLGIPIENGAVVGFEALKIMAARRGERELLARLNELEPEMYARREALASGKISPEEDYRANSSMDNELQAISTKMNGLGFVEGIRHLLAGKPATSLTGRFVRAWAANLLPTRQSAGVTMRGGDIIDYDRAEGLFGMLGQDVDTGSAYVDDMLSRISPNRNLDWLLRIAPTEAFASSFVLAEEKWYDEGLDKIGMTPTEKEQWFELEMAFNMGTPRMLDHMLSQEVDIGTYMMDFGDVFYDWLPDISVGRKKGEVVDGEFVPGQLFPRVALGREDDPGYIGLKDAVGAANVALQFGLEFDGIIGGVYGVSGGTALVRKGMSKLGAEAQNFQGVAGKRMFSDLLGKGPGVEERLAQVDWTPQYRERAYRRVADLMDASVRSTNASPTGEVVTRALQSGAITTTDVETYVYAIRSMSKDKAAAGDAIFHGAIVRWLGDQGLNLGQKDEALFELIRTYLGRATDRVDAKRHTLAKKLDDLAKIQDEQGRLLASIEYIEESKALLLDELKIYEDAWNVASAEAIRAQAAFKEFVESARLAGVSGDLSKVSPKVTRLLDNLENPDMLADALKVGRQEMRLEDFVARYGDRLKELGFKLDSDGFKEWSMTALTRLARQTSEEKAYRTLQTLSAQARNAKIVADRAENVYRVFKGGLSERIMTQFRSAGIREPQLGISMNMPEASRLVEDVLADMKLKEQEALAYKMQQEMAKVIETTAAEGPGVSVAHLLDSLFLFADGARRMRRLDPADIRAFADAWSGVGSYGYIKALSDGNPRVQRAAKKFFPEEGRGASQRDLELLYAGEKVRSTFADPRQVYKVLQRQRASRWDIFGPEDGFKNWYQIQQSVGLATYRTGVMLKELGEALPLVNRWIKSTPLKIHEDSQFAIRRFNRRMKGINTSVSVIIEHAKSADEAFDDLMALFSQRGGLYVLESKYAKRLKIAGIQFDKIFPYLGLDKLTLSSIVDLDQSLIRYGLDHIRDERFVHSTQVDHIKYGLTGQDASETMLLTALIKSYVDERASLILPKNKGKRPQDLDPIMEDIRNYVHKNYDWSRLGGKGAQLSTDRQLFEELEMLIIDGINAYGRKNLTAVVKPATGEMGARYADARAKAVQILLLGASDELRELELIRATNMRSTGPGTGDFMNYVNRDFRGPSIAAQNATRSARPWAPGDFVVDVEEAELFNTLFRDLGDFKYNPEKPVGQRIETPKDDPGAAYSYEEDLSTPSGRRKVLVEEPKARRPGQAWWTELRVTPENPELHALWDRFPEWEAVWMNKVGQRPAMQILSVDEGARTVTLTNGQVRSFDTIARRDIRVSWFDAMDGNARWGFEAFASPGMKKRYEAQELIVRNQYSAMVLRGNGRTGLKTIPYELVASINEEISRLTKIFDDAMSEVMATGLAGQVQKYLVKLKRPWDLGYRAFRQHILFGLFVPRVAYIPIQFFQDSINLTYYHGMEGLGLSLVGGMAATPYIGPWMQDRFFRAMGDLQGPPRRLPGASFLSAFTDRNWSKFYEASDDVAMIENGKPVTYRRLMAEAETAGAREWIGMDDYATVGKRMTERVLNDPKNKDKFRQLLDEGILTQQSVNRQFQLGIQDAVSRMRAVTYWYYRVHKRMSQLEAEKMLDRTLINWSDSVSEWEKSIFGSLFMFYTLHKNAFLQVTDAFTEMSELGRTFPEQFRAYNKKFRSFDTRAQRLKLLSRYSAQPQQWAPRPGELLSREEQVEQAQQSDMSKWLSRYPIAGNPSRATLGQMDRYWNAVGRRFDFIIPTLPLVSQVEYLTAMLQAAEMFLAAPIAIGTTLLTDQGERIPYAVDSQQYWSAVGDFGGSYMNPMADFMMTLILAGMTGESRAVSPYGPRAAVGNTYVLDGMSQMGAPVEDILMEEYTDTNGEKRMRSKVGPFNWYVKEYAFDPISKETDMFFLYLGFITGKRDLSSAKVQALVETDSHFRVRYEAAREAFGLYRKSLISTELEREMRIKAQLRAQRRIETGADQRFTSAKAEALKRDQGIDTPGYTLPPTPWFADPSERDKED
tara:strand:+ start:72 stop:7601 length:7530 start_codon:yes stop_codon:yes gene_type:complete